MNWAKRARRWLVDPVASVTDPQDRLQAPLYAAFILTIASIGLTLGMWVFPVVQGARKLSDNATWSAGAVAAAGFGVAYVFARFGRLRAAAYGTVATSVVCSYMGALEEPRVLFFMN